MELYSLKSDQDDKVLIKPFESIISNDIRNTVNILARRLDIKGYAKFDFIVQENRYYLIEINAQVSFHPDGEFMISAYCHGYKYEDIILYILKNSENKNHRVFSLGFI